MLQAWPSAVKAELSPGMQTPHCCLTNAAKTEFTCFNSININFIFFRISRVPAVHGTNSSDILTRYVAWNG